MLLHCIEVIRRDLPRVIQTKSSIDHLRRESISEAMEIGDSSNDAHSFEVKNEKGKGICTNDSDSFMKDDDLTSCKEEEKFQTHKGDTMSYLEYEPVLVAVVG